MEGMTRAQVDKAESKDFALGGKPMRPRDAATLLLLDRVGDTVNVLMGRRHKRHAFMPGKFVFRAGARILRIAASQLHSRCPPKSNRDWPAQAVARRLHAPGQSPCLPSVKPMRKPAC
jgi:hypothetical protein